MNVIQGPSRSGKTNRLVQHSLQTGIPIVSPSTGHSIEIERAYKKLGHHVHPIPITELTTDRYRRGRPAKIVLVDDAGYALERLLKCKVDSIAIESDLDCDERLVIADWLDERGESSAADLLRKSVMRHAR